jgi:O-antigen ligase
LPKGDWFYMRSLFLLDDKAGVLNLKEKILYVLVALFFATLYMPHIVTIPNIILGLIALLSFFYNSWQEKARLLRQRTEVLLIILFYIVHIVSAFLSENRTEGFTNMVMRLPLLAFPVVFGWMYIRQALKERILYAYAVITVLFVLFCIIYGLVQYTNTNDAALLYNDSLTVIIDKQSIYITMLANLAIFSFAYLMNIQSHLVAKRAMVYIGIFILLVANFLLASRIGITILYTSIIGYAVYYMVKEKKVFLGLTLVIGLLIGAFLLVKLFPKTVNRFKELTYTKYDFKSQAPESHYNMDVTADQWNGANIRLAVWTCGWDLVKQHPVFGVQLGDKMDKLLAMYADRKFGLALKRRLNLHNNYLDVLVAFGFTGLLLFLAGFIVIPFVKSIRTRDFFGCIVILAFALSLVPETYMDRSFGNMLLSFFIAFIISYRKPAEQHG